MFITAVYLILLTVRKFDINSCSTCFTGGADRSCFLGVQLLHILKTSPKDLTT